MRVKTVVKKLLLYSASIAFLWTCSQLAPPDAPKDGTPSKTIINPTGPRARASDLPAPPALNDSKLIRRLTIDLHHKLPVESNWSYFENEDYSLISFIDKLMEEPQFAKALATAHLKIWQLERSKLKDLKQFAENDPSFFNAFTIEQEQNFKEELLLLLRYVIQNNQPTRVLFESPWSIAHDQLITLLGESKLDTPWENEPYGRFKYTNRPSLGILAMSSLYATIDSENRNNGNNAAFHFLENFLCMDLESYSGHDFSKLTEDELKQDLFTVANKNNNCVGCHSHINNLSTHLHPFQQGTNFEDWLDYQPSSSISKSIILSKEVSETNQLPSVLAESNNFHNCFIKNILTSYLQRPLGDHDIPEYARIFQEYKRNQFILKPALRSFFINQSYTSAPLTKEDSSKIKSAHSGVKVLNNIQLESIFSQFLTTTDQLQFPDELSLEGHKVQQKDSFRISDQYFYYLKKIASEVAEKIVDSELVSGSVSETRKLFKTLPDHEGVTEDLDVIHQQIIELWFQFTSETISTNDEQMDRLKVLWDSGYQSETNAPANTLTAWKVLLTGVLISPEFFMY